VGDYNPQVRAHVAIPAALELAGKAVNCEVKPTWLHTTALGNNLHAELSGLDGFWCVPASPYENMAGALGAIRFARESNYPFLGTCGGFQHAVIEYARDVLGLVEADHAESNPTAKLPLISPLACSLVGACGSIRLQPGSQAARIFGQSEILEEYHCNYGLTREFQHLLNGSNLKIVGEDENKEPRIVELDNHRFFFATLFQPELSALSGKTHPLIVAFVRACGCAS
jgi:CTP synthase (UTP-ammonia lyase)